MSTRARACLLAVLMLGGTSLRAEPAPPPAGSTASTDSIARHAAAREFLTVSRFRDRQRVLLFDGLLSARADLAGDCVNRAAEGRKLTGCHVTDVSNPQLHAILKDAEDKILDRVMVVAEDVYAARFTPAELGAIAQFFETPLGRKYAAAYPTLLEGISQQKKQILEDFLLHEALPHVSAVAKSPAG